MKDFFLFHFSVIHPSSHLTLHDPPSIIHSRLGERAELEPCSGKRTEFEPRLGERASRSGVKGEGFFSFSFFRFEDAALPPKK